jgi:hypothetical protein
MTGFHATYDFLKTRGFDEMRGYPGVYNHSWKKRFPLLSIQSLYVVRYTHARHMLCIAETFSYSFSEASMATRKGDKLEIHCYKAWRRSIHTADYKCCSRSPRDA